FAGSFRRCSSLPRAYPSRHSFRSERRLPMASAKHLAHAESALRKVALAYPQAKEDFPWGHRAIKVKGKIFLILSNGKNPDGSFSLSLKLPVSGKMALSLSFASPTEYGLGKSGRVSARSPAQA